MQQVLPVQARPNGEVVIMGHGLDANHVLEVHLIDGANDYKVAIVQQCDTAIRFRVPAKIAAGDMRIAIMIPHFLTVVEQPLFLRILEPVG